MRRMTSEFRKRVGQDPAKLASAEEESFEDAQAEAQKYVVPNAFPQLAEENGAEGLNASTEEDSTQFFWSMPSNRLELWAYMESGRIGIIRWSASSIRNGMWCRKSGGCGSTPAPIGRMVEQMLATAYVAHPYGRSGVGMGERDQPGHGDGGGSVSQEVLCAGEYRDCGGGRCEGRDDDADAREVLWRDSRGAEAGADDDGRADAVCGAVGRRSGRRRSRSFLEGYHRPDYRDPDDAVYDAISDIFSNGRTARLYKSSGEWTRRLPRQAAGVQRVSGIRSIRACMRCYRGAAAGAYGRRDAGLRSTRSWNG